ncbi:MAG: hypothetical protein ACRD2U_13895 [Terriglobales bacterium]
MKAVGISLVLLLGLMLGGCGNSNNSGNINGNWTASLTDPTNNTGPVFAFTTSFTQMSGSSVSVTNFKFTSENDSCFGTAGTATGTFTLAGDFNGNVTGSFSMTIQSASPTGNTLTLSNGAVTNGTVIGTWTLTGPGCSGSGAFTLNKM